MARKKRFAPNDNNLAIAYYRFSSHSQNDASIDQQRELADFLFENGATLVLGGHVHVPQPMELRELPDEQYFSLLQDLAVAHALPQEGTLYLSPADRQRVPALFEEGLNAALGDPAAKLTLAEDTRDIDGGVVLVYGGIEENCSFTALFDDKADALQDMVQALLF